MSDLASLADSGEQFAVINAKTDSDDGTPEEIAICDSGKNAVSVTVLMLGDLPRLKNLVAHFEKLLQGQCVFRPAVLHDILLTTLNSFQ